MLEVEGGGLLLWEQGLGILYTFFSELTTALKN